MDVLVFFPHRTFSKASETPARLMFQCGQCKFDLEWVREKLPETNSSHLKKDGWKTTVSFWDGATWEVRGVSFRETTCEAKTLKESSQLVST